MKRLQNPFSERPVPRMIGAALAAAVVGYVGFIGVTGGIADSKRPKHMSEIRPLLERHLAEKQSADGLMKLAKTPPKRGGSFSFASSEFEEQYSFENVAERVAKHRVYAEGKEQPRPGYTFDAQAFLDNEVPILSVDVKLQVEDAELKTTLFESGRSYEHLYGSKAPPEDLYRAYLDAAVEARWFITSVRYNSRLNRGYINGRRNGAELEIRVNSSPVFPGFPVTVYLLVQGEDLKW